MSWQPIDWYDTPRDYDLVFDVDTALEADFLEELQRRHGRLGRRRVLEPACGSGRLVAELAARGHSVTGYDISRPMLDHARTRLRAADLRARLEVGALESHRPRGRYELAHCLVSTFKYIADEAGARAHLERVAEALVPGGLYVLGFHLSDYERTSRTRERWIARRGATRVVCNIQSWPPERRRRRERVRSRLVVHEGRRERRSETEWWFRSYDARQVASLLRAVPAFELVALHDFTYDPDYERELREAADDCVFVLRKL